MAIWADNWLIDNDYNVSLALSSKGAIWAEAHGTAAIYIRRKLLRCRIDAASHSWG